MVSLNKQQLRIWAKEERKKLDIETLSAILVRKLQKTEEYLQAKNIMLFYPLEYEINLLELLKDATKNFYLPKISGENLLCCPYKEGDKLCESCFKTKEPLTEPIEESIIDLVIVPALAVDKNNYRLGYGGGFYDRLLAKMKKTIKVACIPKEFIIDTIYSESYDESVDKVVSA